MRFVPASTFLACLAWTLEGSPLSPEEALKEFVVDERLEVSLVAAEPLTVAPCAVVWDAVGRMFVAENRGYPGEKPGPALGRVALLEDLNGDGTVDRRREFATGLTFPNGLLPWKEGLIVTCAPDILYLKDTDGDGRADVREVLLTGYDQSKTTQLRVSHPTLGPDGWIYLTSGWGGEHRVGSPRRPDQPAVIFGSDSRFHPENFAIEAISGRAQFGQTFDDAGNRFICFNRVHLQQVVLQASELARNPAYAFSQTVQEVPENLQSDLIGGAHQNPAARIYPISDNVTTADSHAGQFSAACGVTIYRGSGLPEEYYGDAFACDPTGNLVHRDKLTPRGPTFSSHMANEPREFLAARDNWFRPVNLAVGPDGGLYICDMYRGMIEHPEYLPEAVRKRTDFEQGREKGRIWRIARKGTTLKMPGLSTAKAQGLVELLGHPNVWQRETASRLLRERHSREWPALLGKRVLQGGLDEKELLASPRLAAETNTHAHLQELNEFMLYGSTTGDNELARVLIGGSFHASPSVRLNAFRSMRRISKQGIELSDKILFSWADDPSPAVRFEVALLLGNWVYGRSLEALARIAIRDGDEKWTRAAILSGLPGRANEFFDRLMRQTNGAPPPELMSELCRLELNPFEALAGLTDLETARRLYGQAHAKTAEQADWQLAGLAGLVERFRSQENPPRLSEYVDKAFGDGNAWKVDGKQLEKLISSLPGILDDSSLPARRRVHALSILAHENETQALRSIENLLASPALPVDLQRAAIREVIRAKDVKALSNLWRRENWARLTPGSQNLLLVEAITRPAQLHSLITALETGQPPVSAIPARIRNQLQANKDAEIRERARKLFAQSGPDRTKTYEESKTVLTLAARSDRGRIVFKTHCASCHRLEREGFNVGPDIFGVRNQSKEAILLHVVDPNHEITGGFQAYEVELADGRTLAGLITSDTSAAITLRQPQGLEETLPRKQIKTLRATTLSLMPEGLEAFMSGQELADLLAYLKGE